MFVNSLVSTSWPRAVKYLPAQHLVAQRWRTIDQTASSLVSSVNSALDTCRACAGTTETATVARSSSSAKIVLFSPATSKERFHLCREHNLWLYLIINCLFECRNCKQNSINFPYITHSVGYSHMYQHYSDMAVIMIPLCVCVSLSQEYLQHACGGRSQQQCT